MKKQRFDIKLGETTIAYTLYRKKPTIEGASLGSPKRLMMLHGAGVAGELTWSFVIHYLKEWDEILVPDLLGMGDSYFEPTDTDCFTIEDICHTLFSLLRHISWKTFDLVGYSLGGLVALEFNNQTKVELDASHKPDFVVNKMGLIEPALLNDPSLHAALAFRQLFTPIANSIIAEPENRDSFFDFLDLVSPNRIRNEKSDQVAVDRLQKRSHGFANALMAVSLYVESLNENKLNKLMSVIPEGIGIIGGLSAVGLVIAQDRIRKHQKKWHVEILAKADHSLVYVRPRQVAQLVNEYLG